MFDTTEDSEASDGEIIPGDESQDEDTADDGEIFEADETEAVEPESDALILEETIDDPDATDENAASDDTAVADETTASDETAADETEQPSDEDADVPEVEIAADSVDEFVSEGDFDELPTEDSEDEELFFVDEGEMESVSSEAMYADGESNVPLSLWNSTPEWGDIAIKINGADLVLNESNLYPYPEGTQVDVTLTPKKGAVLTHHDSMGRVNINIINAGGTIEFNDDKVYTEQEPFKYSFELSGYASSINVRFTPPSNGIVVEKTGEGTVSVTVNDTVANTANEGDTITVTATPGEGYTLLDGGIYVQHEEDNSMYAQYKLDGNNTSNVHTFTFQKSGEAEYIKVKFVKPDYVVTLKDDESDGIIGTYSSTDNSDRFVNLNGEYNFVFPNIDSYYEGKTEVQQVQFTSVKGNYYYPQAAGDKYPLVDGASLTFYARLYTPETKYNINITPSVNGGVTVSALSATAGTSICVSPGAERGYKLETLSVKQGDTVIELDEDYYFTMPAGDVTVTATFVEDTENFHRIDVADIVNGTVDLNKDDAHAYKDEDILVWPRAAEGYEVSQVTVTGKDGTVIEVSPLSEESSGTWHFSMPNQDVTVSVVFSQTQPEPQENLLQVHNDTPDWGSVAVKIGGEAVAPRDGGTYTTFFPIPDNSQVSIVFTPNEGCSLIPGKDISIYPGGISGEDLGKTYTHDDAPFTYTFYYAEGNDLPYVSVSFGAPANTVVIERMSYPDGGTITVKVGDAEPVAGQSGQSFEAETNAEITVTVVPNDGYRLLSGGIYAFHAGENGKRNDIRAFDPDGQRVYGSGETASHTFTKTDSADHVWVGFEPVTNYTVQVKKEDETVVGEYTLDNNPGRFTIREGNYNFIFPSDLHPFGTLTDGQVEYYYDKFNNPMGPAGATSPVTEAVSTYYIKVSTQGSGGPGGLVDPSVDGYALLGGTTGNFNMGDMSNAVKFLVEGQEVRRAKAGEKVTVQINAQWYPVQLVCKYAEGTQYLDLESPTFTMPASDVFVTAWLSQQPPHTGAYKFIYNDSHGCTIIAYVRGGVGDAISANANEYVNLNVYPPQEWIYDGACVVTYGDTTLNLSNHQGFTMPAQDVTITPILSPAHTGQYSIRMTGGGMQGHGNAYVDNARAVSANAGETVELRINANVGYKVTGATLTYNGQTQKLTADNMTFTMPEGDVEVTPEFASDGIIINDENFPDKNLQTTLKQLGYGVHMEGSDYVISAGMVGYLEVNNVEDYTGLDQFTKLNRLVITGNEITTLTLSNPTLTSVMLGNCENLTSVDLSGCPNLIDLNFEGDTGKVTSLDVSGCTKLTELLARGAALTTLDVSNNTELVTLDCNSNQLTELDVSQNTKLESLRCYSNRITALNLANNPEIQKYVEDQNKRNINDTQEGYTCIAYVNPDAEEWDSWVLAYDPDVEISLAPTFAITKKVVNNGASGTIDASAAAAANQVVTVTLVPDENSVAGSLSVTFDGEAVQTSFADGMYTFKMPEGEVTLTATFLKIPTVIAPVAEELTYNGEDQALVSAGETDGGTLQYSLDGVNWNTEIPKGKDARDYTVYYRVVGNESYTNYTAEEPVTVTIAKAPATVKIGNNGNKTKTYGNEDPELTTEDYEVEGLISGDSLGDITFVRQAGENVKRYDYSLDTVENANYDVTVEGTLTIKPKEISASDIEWSEGPFTYDGKAQLPTATIKSDAIVKWDEKADECDVTVVAADDDNATDAGEHTAVAVSLSNANYKLEGNLKHTYTIGQADHEDVPNALEIAISANGVTDGKADLSQCIPESAAWSVVEYDNTLINAATAGENRTLNYTAAPAAAEVTGGWVTIEVEETNYQPYKVTVKFVTSDVFTLSFDSKGGEPVESRRLHAGVPYGALPELKRDYYTFGGWVDSADHPVNAETAMGSGDTTIFAKWEPIVYTVSLYYNGHAPSTQPDDYTDGKKTFTIKDEAFDLPKLADVTEESKVYTFSGWILDGETTAYTDVHIDPAEALKTISEDKTIKYTAQWTEGTMIGEVKYEKPEDDLSGILGIKDMGDDGKVSTDFSQDSEANKSTSLAEALKQIAVDKSSAIEEGATSKKVTVDMVVSAKNITDDDKSDILMKVEEPEVEGVDVKTDFINIDITQTTSYTNEANVQVDEQPESLHELSRVVEIPLNYDMTGRYNLRLFRKHDSTVEEFDKLSARPKSGKDMKDRTFFISGYGGSAVIYIYSSRFSTFAASSDNRESFEVAFDSNGGTKVDTQRVYKGEKVTTPSDPTRAATATVRYTFDGWYKDGEKYDFDTPVTAAITLYARWKETAIPVNDTTQDSTKSDSVSPAPVAAAAPAPASEAEPMPTIISNKKNVKATVEVGKVYQIDLLDQSLVGKKYKSSKKKIATVSATGLVTPKKAGKVKITFKVGKKKRTITLKVVDPTVPKGIQLNATSLTVKKGETQTLTYTLLPEGIAKSAVTWKTSNKKVATVKNGVVTFKKKGKVTITAITKSGKKKAKVKFTVTD